MREAWPMGRDLRRPRSERSPSADIIVVCRKRGISDVFRPSTDEATEVARGKIARLHAAGFDLSRNDQQVVLFGQLLTALRHPDEAVCFTQV